MQASDMIKENARRHDEMFARFDPITGEGSVGKRRKVCVSGLDVDTMWLPEPMLRVAWVKHLCDEGSVAGYLSRGMCLAQDDSSGADVTVPKSIETVKAMFERERCLHDFPYWAARYIYIKRKGGGDDVTLRLTYPQRLFVDCLEQCRLAGKPIRIVLLKARQWGGSTVSQLYMAWLQLVHSTGLNSLIIAHQGTASDEIKDMFDRAIGKYPLQLLHDIGDEYKANEKKTVTVGRSGSTFRVPQRNCKIKIGTAERPDSCRGGDYNLVHLSEVGLWRRTDGKCPEDIVRAACAGVVYAPLTMIVYESTANGVGNFFHREYIDARDNPRSQFRSLFVSWHQIEHNRLEFADDADRLRFASWLIANRQKADAASNREEPGRYLWWLWQQGATLEGINWYIMERAKHSLHGSMAAECPTDDTEAFVNSGAAVFDKYKIVDMRPDCHPPRRIGEITSATPTSLDDLRFVPDNTGNLWVWSLPDFAVARGDGSYVVSQPSTVTDRYLVVVDIGGRSFRADWSVIVVFDRLMMIGAGTPAVVAQWRGHCDMDHLAWRAARIAAFYEDALLVIESNTLETHDRERQVEGDQSHFILNQIRSVYPNLYARRQSEEDIRMQRPRKYGFHTNISTKPMIISTLVKVVREHLYTERDERCLNEYLVYERRQNGSYGAIVGEHDDLLMTRAIGMHICFYEMPMPRITQAQTRGIAQSKVVSAATL